MKVITPTIVLASTLLLTGATYADDGNRKHFNKRHQHEQQVEHNKTSKRHNYRHGRKMDLVRLDIPVYLRGNDRVHLRKAIRENYGLNPNHYRLKKVVVNSRGYRPAKAKLIVGHDYADKQRLERGRNVFHAPRHSDGRWVLGVKDARINNIRVVLEPKHRWAYAKPRYKHRAWFEDNARQARRW